MKSKPLLTSAIATLCLSAGLTAFAGIDNPTVKKFETPNGNFTFNLSNGATLYSAEGTTTCNLPAREETETVKITATKSNLPEGVFEWSIQGTVMTENGFYKSIDFDNPFEVPKGELTLIADYCDGVRIWAVVEHINTNEVTTVNFDFSTATREIKFRPYAPDGTIPTYTYSGVEPAGNISVAGNNLQIYNLKYGRAILFFYKTTSLDAKYAADQVYVGDVLTNIPATDPDWAFAQTNYYGLTDGTDFTVVLATATNSENDLITNENIPFNTYAPEFTESPAYGEFEHDVNKYGIFTLTSCINGRTIFGLQFNPGTRENFKKPHCQNINSIEGFDVAQTFGNIQGSSYLQTMNSPSYFQQEDLYAIAPNEYVTQIVKTGDPRFDYQPSQMLQQFGGGPVLQAYFVESISNTEPSLTFRAYGFFGDFRKVDNNNLITKRELKCGEDVYDNFLALNSSGYTGNIECHLEDPNYVIDDIQGLSVADFTIDRTKTDIYPPTLTSISLRDTEGNIGYSFPTSDGLTIGITAEDVSYAYTTHYEWTLTDVAELKAEYAVHGTDEWVLLPTNSLGFDDNYGGLYGADLSYIQGPDPSQPTYFDLRLTITDEAGNTAVQSILPAFKVDTFVPAKDEVEVADCKILNESTELTVDDVLKVGFNASCTKGSFAGKFSLQTFDETSAPYILVDSKEVTLEEGGDAQYIEIECPLSLFVENKKYTCAVFATVNDEFVQLSSALNFSVVKESGIDTIDSDNIAAEYFTLQGVSLGTEKPASGIYVKVTRLGDGTTQAIKECVK